MVDLKDEGKSNPINQQGLRFIGVHSKDSAGTIYSVAYVRGESLPKHYEAPKDIVISGIREISFLDTAKETLRRRTLLAHKIEDCMRLRRARYGEDGIEAYFKLEEGAASRGWMYADEPARFDREEDEIDKALEEIRKVRKETDELAEKLYLRNLLTKARELGNSDLGSIMGYKVRFVLGKSGKARCNGYIFPRESFKFPDSMSEKSGFKFWDNGDYNLFQQLMQEYQQKHTKSPADAPSPIILDVFARVQPLTLSSQELELAKSLRQARLDREQLKRAIQEKEPAEESPESPADKKTSEIHELENKIKLMVNDRWANWATAA